MVDIDGDRHLQNDLEDFRRFARYVTEWLAQKGYLARQTGA